MGITPQQALDCFASDDLIGIGMEADAVRRRLHPEGVVSYVVDRSISLSGGNAEAIYNDIRKTLDMGGTGVHLEDTAGLNIEALELLLSAIKQRFPEVWLQGLSATEILSLAAGSDMRSTLAPLRNAGLDSLAGTCSCSTEDWIAVHRAAHQAGMRTTATMTFGGGETVEQRVHHLDAIRRLQEETGGFTAFIPWSFQPDAIALENRTMEEPTSVEYLTMLAVGRMFLDNIANVESSAANQGLKVLQMSLRFGGNDVGSVVLEENTGKSGLATEEELRRIIRDAGFKPVQRDTLYRTMFLN